ncbi:hypothetical protein SO802_009356 [Lithocarpus litseifolius]|uniref:BED-type domain-containing protein n=1 Tax=Lithocarpus litseifolius TaxID=425828 RepID=A0AAW2DE18_9ROSI
MNGNHETLNVERDFRYMSESGCEEFRVWAHNNMMHREPLKSSVDIQPEWNMLDQIPFSTFYSYSYVPGMESDEMIPIEIKYEGGDIDLEDELDEVAELPLPKKAKTKSKNKKNNKDNKRRRTSYVCSFFELLPTKDEEKPTCKCKKCGKEYIAARAYGTGNLKRHLEVCPRKDTRMLANLYLAKMQCL